MNEKKVKALRRAVFLSGKHPREASYDLRNPYRIPHPFGASAGALFLGHATLKPACGRAIYKRMKRDRKNAKRLRDAASS